MKKSSFIKELASFSCPLPITDEEIVERIFSGEDLQIIDLNIIRKNYKILQSAFYYAKIYTAVKALSVQREIPTVVPDGGMISILDHLGSNFEIATIEEFRKLHTLGILSNRIMFTHTDKDFLEMKESYQGGVKTFVSDSISDLKIIAEQAPEAEILIRITAWRQESGEWFNRRFGVSAETAKKLLKLAKNMSLKPIGIAFHVGTQAQSPKSWKKPIQVAGNIFKKMKKEGIELSVLDIGGGIPFINRGEHI